MLSAPCSAIAAPIECVADASVAWIWRQTGGAGTSER